jgi:hypothetical protein
VKAVGPLSKRAAVPRWRELEMPRDGGADIGEAATHTDRIAGPAVDEQDRHLLARMIGAGPGRIAAVICGDHKQVVIFEYIEQFRQPGIEIFQRAGVTLDVATVTILRVEVDEIGK